MRAPPVYLAGPDGFTAAGLAWHRHTVVPAVAAAGLQPVSPWVGVDLPSEAGVADHRQRNRELGAANAAAIRDAAGVLALLDGPDVDSGTAAEIGYAAALGRPVVGLRTDRRQSGDNPGAAINLQVEWFIEASGGRVCRELGEAVGELARLAGPRWLASAAGR